MILSDVPFPPMDTPLRDVLRPCGNLPSRWRVATQLRLLVTARIPTKVPWHILYVPPF
jgi:hypothetical protein